MLAQQCLRCQSIGKGERKCSLKPTVGDALRKLIMLAVLALVNVPAAAKPADTTSTIEIAGPVLMVTDLERSLKFYVGALGLQEMRRLPGKPGPGAIIVAPGHSPQPFMLLQQGAPLAEQSPAIDHGNALSRMMLVVADSTAVAERLTAMGFAHEPVNARGIFFVKDPDGYRLEIMQRETERPTG
ncbi:MAG: VOC family protein [Novosphingobium sp.]|nr:VOC family protein [Novosphingobium sp.]